MLTKASFCFDAILNQELIYMCKCIHAATHCKNKLFRTQGDKKDVNYFNTEIQDAQHFPFKQYKR